MSYPADTTRLDLTLKMTGADGRESIEHRTVEIQDHPDAGALHRVFHFLHTGLRITPRDQALPRQDERARAWLKFSGKPASIMRFFDIRNAQTMWLELSNLIIGAEADFVLSQTFKALEPSQELQFEDSVAINDLYFIHDRKMNLLNTAVWVLIKSKILSCAFCMKASAATLWMQPFPTGSAERVGAKSRSTRATVLPGRRSRRCGRHAPCLQDRHSARTRREKSRSACRDALEDRLQGHRHHACANACVPEGTPLASSLHAGAHLRRYSAPRFGDAGATLVGLAVGGRTDTDPKRWAKGEDGETKTEASNGYVPLHTVLARFLREWRAQTPFASDGDFVFPSLKAAGRVPLSASIFVADHLQPAAKKAGVHIEDGQRFGLHNLRHSLSNWLVNKAKVRRETVQGILRHARIQTTLDLCTQEDGNEALTAQGEYLTALEVGTHMVQ